MNMYCRSLIGLTEVLNASIGFQCQMTTCEGEFYRGQIKSFSVPKGAKRKVLIHLDWLCVRRSGFDPLDSSKTRWEVIPIAPPLLHTFDVEYYIYCIQKDEDRVKIKSWRGDSWKIYNNEDHARLVLHEGEWIPYAELHAKEFLAAIKLAQKLKDK